MRLVQDRRGAIMVEHLIVTFVNLCVGAAIIAILGPSIILSYRFTQMITLLPTP